MAKRKKLLMGINTIDELLNLDSTHVLIDRWIADCDKTVRNLIMIWVDEDGVVRLASAGIDNSLIMRGILAEADSLSRNGGWDAVEDSEENEDNVA